MGPLMQPLPRLSIGKRTRADDVADHLAALIDESEFPIGSQLPSEKDLADRFGVGRPAVRQALFYLQQQGLVKIASGKRAEVARPGYDFMNEQAATLVRRIASTPDGQTHMEEARLLFEPGISLQAAMRATPHQVSALKDKLEANIAAAGKPSEFVRTDVAFHYEITLITENPVFIALHDIMQEWLVDQRTNTIHMQGADELSIRDHTAIFEAIAAREPMRAFQAMAAHLRLISALYHEAKKISDTVFRKMVTEVTNRVEAEMNQMWTQGTSLKDAEHRPK